MIQKFHSEFVLNLSFLSLPDARIYVSSVNVSWMYYHMRKKATIVNGQMTSLTILSIPNWSFPNLNSPTLSLNLQVSQL